MNLAMKIQRKQLVLPVGTYFTDLNNTQSKGKPLNMPSCPWDDREITRGAPKAEF